MEHKQRMMISNTSAVENYTGERGIKEFAAFLGNEIHFKIRDICIHSRDRSARVTSKLYRSKLLNTWNRWSQRIG